MKSLNFIFALLCLPVCLAKTQEETVHKQLVELAAAGNGVIKLDSKTFDLLTSSKRTWSTTIQLTALDSRRRCTPCKAFDPSFNAVAKAWATTSKKHKDEHFFATLDFDEGQTVFQRLGLSSAPVVQVYPAAEGPRAPPSGKAGPIPYDFSSGYEPSTLAQAMSRYTPTAIPYSDPIDWARYGTYAVGFLSFLVALRFIAPILQSRWTWAVISIGVSLVMTSGYMFVRIRNSPYAGQDGSWIAGGYQNQYGQEVSVIAFIYGLLAFSFLMLIMVIPYQTSPNRQRLQIYLWSGVIMIIYSILVSIFRVKNRGYPFKLFL